MILDGRKVIVFKCSGKLREKVNGKRSTPGMKD